MKFYKCLVMVVSFSGRAPQGARGLKFASLWNIAPREGVAPRKGRVG